MIVDLWIVNCLGFIMVGCLLVCWLRCWFLVLAEVLLLFHVDYGFGGSVGVWFGLGIRCLPGLVFAFVCRLFRVACFEVCVRLWLLAVLWVICCCGLLD